MTTIETLRDLDSVLQGVSRDLLDLFNDNEEKWNTPAPIRERIEEIETRLWHAVASIGITK